MDNSLYDLFHQSIVRLVDTSSHEQGTGFFVAPGLILTCAHVVKKASARSTPSDPRSLLGNPDEPGTRDRVF